MTIKLEVLLRKLVHLGGSDLHLAAGSFPRGRIRGDLIPISERAMAAQEPESLFFELMTEEQKEKIRDLRELDFSFSVAGLGRFRASLFRQRSLLSGVVRHIPEEIPKLENLGLPGIVATLCEKPRGLVLVTGPTGCGKSTTLAAMIDRLNRTRRLHILTVEDPIEFWHANRESVVNQREVGIDTPSFASALRMALREDPDVVLVGEMRDLETIEAALRIAETGHLTLATLHTNSAPSSVHRIVDVFPSHQQEQIRSQLSLVLEGIVTQILVNRLDGTGRIPATEVLVATPAIRNLIRENRIHQIPSTLQTSGEQFGMHTLGQSLLTHYRAGLISKECCLNHSPNREETIRQMERTPLSI